MKDVEATAGPKAEQQLQDHVVCVRMYNESALNKLTADNMATAADDGSATGAAASKDKFLNAKPIEGCVCDLDGTMLDTEPIYYSSYEKAANKYGKDYSWDIHKLIVGRAELTGAQVVVDQLKLADVTPQQYLDTRDEFLKELMRKAKPLPGALEVVKLMKRKCKRIAIATSSYTEYLELKREGNKELFDMFDAIICGDNKKIAKGKPAPDIFLVAAEAIGIAPEHCLAFEDSVAGTQSARAAGMTVVTVPDHRLDVSLFKDAHLILKSLTDFDASQVQFAQDLAE